MVKKIQLLQIAGAGSLAPSTISVYNKGKVQYRGEKAIQEGSGFVSSAEFLQQNRGIGGMLKKKR